MGVVNLKTIDNNYAVQQIFGKKNELHMNERESDADQRCRRSLKSWWSQFFLLFSLKAFK